MNRVAACLLAATTLSGCFAYVGAGSYSGSRAGDLSIEIGKESIKEAFLTARTKGMVLGYEAEYYDKGGWVLELHKREGQRGLRLYLFIRVELDVTGGPPVVRLSGEDRAYTGEEWQVAADMKRIAAEVEKCCGARGRDR